MSPADGCFVDGGSATPATQDLWTWLKKGIDLNPSATALRALHKPPDHLANLLSAPSLDSSRLHLAWSYAQLEEAASTLAENLSSRGIGPGDIVTTFLPNSVEVVVFFWAAIQVGATFVPLDPRITSRPEELVYLITVAQSTMIALDDSDAAVRVDHALHETSASCKIKMICSSNGARPPGWQHLSQVEAQEAAPECMYEAELTIKDVNMHDRYFMTSNSSMGSDLYTSLALAPNFKRKGSLDADPIALVLFTSGTTNKPKGCPQSDRGFAAQCDGYRAGQLGAWDATARFLATTSNFRPLFLVGFFATWRSGGCTVIASEIPFDVSSTLAVICAENITHLFVVPSQVREMVKDPTLSGFRPSTLRYINVTGDVVNKDLLDMCKHGLRVENAVSIWGMTEGAGIINWTSPQDVVPFTSSEEGELAGLGRVLPGAKAKVCREGTRELVDWGQKGDLHVCAANFIKTYLGKRDENTFYRDEAGDDWLITGDRARIGPDRIMYIVGRSKDIIVSCGVSLIPGVLEGFLVRLDGIDECQVLGVPHDQLGETPVAIIKTIHDQATPAIDVINAGVRSQLGNEYRLDAMYSLEDLAFGNWPLNDTGKVMKKDLKKAVLDLRAR